MRFYNKCNKWWENRFIGRNPERITAKIASSVETKCEKVAFQNMKYENILLINPKDRLPKDSDYYSQKLDRILYKNGPALSAISKA